MISYYLNYYQKKPKIESFSWFIEGIKSGRWEQHTNKIRAEQDPSKKQQLKEQSSCVRMGQFTGNTDDSLKAHNGRIIIDLDYLEDTVHDIKLIMSDDQYVEACFLSVSGKGLAVVIKIPTINDDAGDENYKYFWALQKYFLDTYDLEIDNKCKNISRIRFISYDPEMYYNRSAELWTGQLEKDPNEKTIPAPLSHDPNRDRVSDVGDPISRIVEMINNADDGNKHGILLSASRVAGGYIASGRIDQAEAIHAMESAIRFKDNVRDINKAFKTIRDGIENGKLRPIHDQPIQSGKLPNTPPAMPIPKEVTQPKPRLMQTDILKLVSIAALSLKGRGLRWTANKFITSLEVLCEVFSLHGIPEKHTFKYIKDHKANGTITDDKTKLIIKRVYEIHKSKFGKKKVIDHNAERQIINKIQSGKFSRKHIMLEFGLTEGNYTLLLETATGISWYSTSDKGAIEVRVLHYCKWLEAVHGIYTHTIEGLDPVVVKLNGSIVRELNIYDLAEIIRHDISSESLDLYDTMFKTTTSANTYLTVQGCLKSLRNIKTATGYEFAKDDYDSRHFFYRDKVVTVLRDKSKFKETDYSKFKSLVWADKILSRPYTKMPATSSGHSKFAQFIQNIAGDNSESFVTAIGYMLHGYKDESNSRAVVVYDQNQDRSSEGGTGKSLLWQGIKTHLSTVVIDGKQLKSKSGNFTLQRVRHETDMIVIDDATAGFQIEQYFIMITGDLTIERKNRDEFTIDFEDAPKLFITTNHSIRGIGNAFDRRKIELETSNHYGPKLQPKDDVGMLYRWKDSDEWAMFDNFMMQCVSIYFAKGIVFQTLVTAHRKKLVSETHDEFPEWFENGVFCGAIDKMTAKQIHEAFIHHLSRVNIDSFNFRRYCDYRKMLVVIKKWAAENNVSLQEKRSNGKKVWLFHFDEKLNQEQDEELHPLVYKHPHLNIAN